MSGGAKAPQAYNPSNQAGADQGYQQYVNDISQALGGQQQVTGQLGQVAQGVQNNPFYQQAQQGAGQVAQQAQGVGAGQQAAAQQLYGLGGLATPLASQIQQSAFDPRAQLYNQQYQQNQDQINAINAQNGVAGSPFGASLAAQGGQQFNLGFQNQQLARQVQGAQAIQGLGQLAQGAYGEGANLASQGLTTLAQGSALPSNTYLNQQSANIAALQALAQGYGQQSNIAAQGVGAEQNYLGLGQSATSINQKAVEYNNQQQQAAFSGLLQAGGLAADIFAPGSGSFITGAGQAAGIGGGGQSSQFANYLDAGLGGYGG